MVFGVADMEYEQCEKRDLRQPAQPGQGQPAPNEGAVARGLGTTTPARQFCPSPVYALARTSASRSSALRGPVGGY